MKQNLLSKNPNNPKLGNSQHLMNEMELKEKGSNPTTVQISDIITGLTGSNHGPGKRNEGTPCNHRITLINTIFATYKHIGFRTREARDCRKFLVISNYTAKMSGLRVNFIIP